MFVYELKLKTNQNQEHQLLKRFRMGEHIYKRTLSEIMRRERKRKKDPLYKRALKTPKGKERNDLYKELDQKYKLTGEYEFATYALEFRKSQNYTALPAASASTLGQRAWRAYFKMRKGQAQRVNFRSTLTSFDGQSGYGVLIRNGLLKMGTKQDKFTCPIIYKNDEFEEEVLRNTLKYNRLVRKFINGKWVFYVQMVFDGIPPQKRPEPLQTTVGIDIGVSTIATSSDYETRLLELAPGIDAKEKEIRRLMRKLDRQRRANNPDNYDETGQVKKGRLKWIESKNHIKTRNRLNTLKRKQAQQRLNAHKKLANEIASSGRTIIVETMNFKGLQARTKETTVDEKTGKNRSKKRYGKTIAHRAPALLISQIKYKTEFAGGTFIEADTTKIKASQLNHTTGEYTKVGLDVRTKEIDGKLVQRDLYSAFLLQHVMEDGKTVDLEQCALDFERFLENQEITMQNLTTKLSSTGVKEFQKGTV